MRLTGLYAFNKEIKKSLSRLHVGHSDVTDLFLLRGEEPPFCVSCDDPLSLEYIWLFCSDLIDITEKILQGRLSEDVVQRGFFGYYLQLLERDHNQTGL